MLKDWKGTVPSDSSATSIRRRVCKQQFNNRKKHTIAWSRLVYLESPMTLLNLPFQEKDFCERKHDFFAYVTKCSFFVCALSDPP